MMSLTFWPVYSGERFRAFRPSCICEESMELAEDACAKVNKYC